MNFIDYTWYYFWIYISIPLFVIGVIKVVIEEITEPEKPEIKITRYKYDCWGNPWNYEDSDKNIKKQNYQKYKKHKKHKKHKKRKVRKLTKKEIKKIVNSNEIEDFNDIEEYNDYVRDR